jgi:hypothetical protein
LNNKLYGSRVCRVVQAVDRYSKGPPPVWDSG